MPPWAPNSSPSGRLALLSPPDPTLSKRPRGAGPPNNGTLVTWLSLALRGDGGELGKGPEGESSGAYSQPICHVG